MPNFFHVIKFSACDEILLEEENMRENFGFLVNDPDTIEKLEKAKMPKKAL